LLVALRWALAAPVAALGGLLIICNSGAFAESAIRRRGASVFPLIGGVCVSIAMLVCPAPGAARLAWVPLIVDPCCALLLLVLAIQAGRARYCGPHRAEFEDGPQ